MRDLKEVMADVVANWERRFGHLEPDPEAEARERAEAAAKAKEARHKALLGRGIPEKDIPLLDGGTKRQTEALAEALRFSKSEDSILVLSGEKGCGKTFAASWLVARDPAAQMFTVSQFSRIDLYDTAAISEVTLPPLVVVDDLGMEYMDPKGFFLAVLDAVFDERYRMRRKTVITTNLHAAEFKARYGERIADRIREAGRFAGLGDSSLRAKQ